MVYDKEIRLVVSKILWLSGNSAIEVHVYCDTIGNLIKG